MTQNNKQILEQANAAVTMGDYESFLSFFAGLTACQNTDQSVFGKTLPDGKGD